MKNFKSFVYPKIKPFVNQHGSHARPIKKKIKKVPFVNQHGSHSRPIKEDDDEDEIKRKTIIEEWHDGTPEGKRHLDTLKTHFHEGGGWSAFEDSRHFSPYEHHVHGMHLHMLDPKNHNDLHDKIIQGHDYSKVTDEQKKSLREYTIGSSSLNLALVHGDKLRPERSQHVHNIDNAISSTVNKIGHPITTFHGTGYDIMSHVHNEGPVIHSRGYTSSSTAFHVASSFGSNVMTLHGNHSPIPIPRDLTFFSHENEVLHPRGLLIRPRSMIRVYPNRYSYNGKKIISADIDGHSPTSFETHESDDK